MQVSLVNPPQISFQNHPNYRVVQVSERQGRAGMLLPHANLVEPDKRVVRDLKDIMHLYEKLRPAEPFNYGTTSGYRKYPEPPQPKEPLKPIEFNKIDDLPLFKNL